MTNKMEVDNVKDKFERKRVVHAVKVIKELHSKWLEEEATKKPLLESTEDTPLLLQITLKKIPYKSNVQMVKIPLPHSLVTDTTEVCLITGDLDKRDKKADIDLTVQHYKDLLRKHNINCISEVVPLRQLRTDYKPFEAKRQLLGAYDVFLTDQKIAQCLPKALGKSFFKKRKFPQQIDLKSKNLKEQIEKTLSNTVLFISGHGSSCSTEVAKLGFSTKKMVENVMAVVASLIQKLPGSWENVYGVYVKTPKSVALPIYMSFESGNDVVLEPKHTKEIVEPEEITTLKKTKVKVYGSGVIKLVPVKTEDSDTDSDYEDEMVKAEKRKRRKIIRRNLKKEKTKEPEKEMTKKLKNVMVKKPKTSGKTLSKSASKVK